MWLAGGKTCPILAPPFLMMRILFITSTNLAANPRLLKELRLAVANGFEATVVQFRFANWSTTHTDSLKKEFPAVDFIEISAMRAPLLPWLIGSMLQGFFSRMPLAWLKHPKFLSLAVSKRSWLLLGELKKQKQRFDWVIAHNPPAFYPALVTAKRLGSFLGIDTEDYHPGESNDPRSTLLMKRLMQQLLPEADYCSYAAPLIASEVKKDIPHMKNRQLLILNGFCGDEFMVPQKIENEAPLKLVWFSQNIDFNRGLEEIIPIVNKLYPAVELHLVGFLKEEFEKKCLQNKQGIIIHAPMLQPELHRFLSGCELGLAVDVPVDRNRELALTNKIIAFIQAGLPVLTFPVRAQHLFLKEHDFHFYATENNHGSLKEVLFKLNRKQLNEQRMEQYEKGKQLNWELLSAPLLAYWKACAKLQAQK